MVEASWSLYQEALSDNIKHCYLRNLEIPSGFINNNRRNCETHLFPVIIVVDIWVALWFCQFLWRCCQTAALIGLEPPYDEVIVVSSDAIINSRPLVKSSRGWFLLRASFSGGNYLVLTSVALPFSVPCFSHLHIWSNCHLIAGYRTSNNWYACLE